MYNKNNLNFPQVGVITTINKSNRTAKVFLPLFKIETGYIKIDKTIPIASDDSDGIRNTSQVVVTFIGGELSNGVVTSWI